MLIEPPHVLKAQMRCPTSSSSLTSNPTGDQPEAIERSSRASRRATRAQTLLGVTGSGKTFTMANIIERCQRPTLVLAPNKTLAAQLYSEFKEFFPDNAVEYFVSYYDYYQPEAYIPRTDTYIAKDADINEEIDKLRHAATRALFERRDVLIVASVSCIYGLGEPEEYQSFVAALQKGEQFDRARASCAAWSTCSTSATTSNLVRGKFRVRGDSLTIHAGLRGAGGAHRLLRRRGRAHHRDRPADRRDAGRARRVDIYPAKHFVTSKDKLEQAIEDIEAELEERLAELRRRASSWRRPRLEERTRYDLEMLREAGYCSGIENYSPSPRAPRRPARTPWTLLDYFPDDWLLFIDESHITIPQVRGMFHGDRRARDAGRLRLPPALGAGQPAAELRGVRETISTRSIFVSATPGPYEQEHSDADRGADHPPDRPARPGDRGASRRRARSTTCWTRCSSASSAASACW